VSLDLGRLLIDADAVSKAEVEAALFVAVVRGISFPRALIDRAAITERALDEQLDRRGGLALRQFAGSRDIFTRLPRAMCRRLGAVPIRLDPATGNIDVAAADPLDPHLPEEFSFHLGSPVRVLRAPLAAVEEAIRVLELDEREPPPGRTRSRRATPAFPHGAPQSTIPPPPSQDIPIPLLRRVSIPSFDLSGPREGARVPQSHPEGARPPPSGPASNGASPASGRDRRGAKLQILDEEPHDAASVGAADEPVLPLRRTKTEPGLADEPVLPLRRTKTEPGLADEPVLPLRQGKTEPGLAGDRAPSARAGAQRAVPSDRGSGAGSHGRPPVLREPAVEPQAISFPSSPPSAPPVEISPAAALLAAIQPELAASREGRSPDSGGRLPAPSTRRHGRLSFDPVAAFAPPPAAPSSGRSAAPSSAAPSSAAPSSAAPSSGRSAVPSSVPGAPRLSPLPPAPEPELDPGDDDPPPQPFADLGDVIDALYIARSRDDVVRLALRGLRLLARRVAIFAAHRAFFRGFACNAEFGDQHALRQLALPMDQPSILATAIATGLYLGPIPGTSTHVPLLDIMVNPSLDVAVVSVPVAGRPAMLLLADQLGDTLSGTRRMDELARSVGEAFTRILSTRG
jgi:Type II secretion system (T2SS), protein E, N-terminal domain